MASHLRRHTHHHQHNNISHQPPHSPLPTAATCCCCCSCCNWSHCCSSTDHPLPPPQADTILHALASQLLLQQPPPQNPHHWKHQFQRPNEHQQTQFILSSLLRRIDALESSLRPFSNYSGYRQYQSFSLEDAAARTIQAHFRAFLVRRSRTLRQIKDLAFVKSSFNSIKSSIANKAHFDFEAVSHNAMDLLLKLDSIQGGDPMIRDGKRSISTDLVRFLEFVDGFALKRAELSYKTAKKVRNARALGSKPVRFGRDKREIMAKLRDRVEKIHGFSRVCENEEEDVEIEGFRQVIDDDDEDDEEKEENSSVFKIRNGVLVKTDGSKPRVKKSVSFAENANVYRVFHHSHEPASSGDSSDEHEEVVEKICSEVEEVKGLSNGNEEAELGNGSSSPQCSDGEEVNPGRNLRVERRIETSSGGDHYQAENGDFVFSAPMPVQMESRADLIKKRRAALKIV